MAPVTVRQVRRVHSHLSPHAPVCKGCRETALTDVAEEVSSSAFVVVEVVGLLLQLGEDRARVFVRPVGEQNHVLAVELHGTGLLRLDDDRAINPFLFVEARVAVVPVGAVLLDREPVVVRLAGSDAVEAQAGNSIHVGG